MKKLLPLFGFSAVAHPACAHVKWFSAIANAANVPHSPFGLFHNLAFVSLAIAAFAVLFLVTFIDFGVSNYRNRITGILHWFDTRMGPVLPVLLRIGVALFFFSIATYFMSSPIILTPELKTNAPWVPALQILIAVLALLPRTTRLASLGILVLYAYAIRQYGWFHMLDYPFFIGVAVFLAINEEFDSTRHFLKIAFLRMTTGLSFLWVAVEKWMYPDWSYDVLENGLSGLLMGFDPAFFVMAAGMVEFCLAFLLIFGRLSSQISAAILLLLMVSAIPLVGLVDAIGHAPAIVVLVILTTTQNRTAYLMGYSRPWDQLGKALAFLVTIPGLIGLYYLAHEFAYRPAGFAASPEMLLGALMMLPMLLIILSTLPHTVRRVFSDARRPVRLVPSLSS